MELRGQLSSCLFCAILLAAIPFSESFEVISFPTVTGIVGQDVLLSCQISIRTQPANMEVQWKKIILAHIEIVHEYRAQTGQDVPGPNYQGRTVLLKDGFTSGNVSLKLKNVQLADRGTYNCIVKSNERSADATTELQIAETSEDNTETSENSTEKKFEATLALQIVALVFLLFLIGFIVFIYYCRRKTRRDPEKGKRRRDPEKGRTQNENDELRLELDELQVELGRVQAEKDDLQVELRRVQAEKDELQVELGRVQAEKDDLQVELRRIQKEKDELQGELNWRRTHKYADDITLNPDTAHPNLSISEVNKKFTHEPEPQKVPPTPERFDSTVCVLGSEGFSSGEHYWEVDVGSSSDWDLGVARKSIQRKGKLSLSPKEGFWALSLSGKDYWAKTDPWTRVMVQKKPKKIGIYLSYQEKQVTFFNVTDMSVLFTFNDCSFSGEVYPFFKNSNKETAMRICSIREDE